MFCKSFNNVRYGIFLFIVGCISLVFGVVANFFVPDQQHDLSMLMGMFTGVGIAFIGIAVFQWVRSKVSSPEKLKQQEIDRNDERNIQIQRASSTASNLVSALLFAVMAFVLVFLGYRTAALISIGALYVQVFTFMAAHRYYSNRM
jgi:uncharacterized membrane protein